MPCHARNVDLSPCRNRQRGRFCAKHRRKRIVWGDADPASLTWRLERNSDRTYSAIGADGQVRFEIRRPYRRMCALLGQDLIDDARVESRPIPLFPEDVVMLLDAVAPGSGRKGHKVSPRHAPS